jgi:hypothetical protein
VALAAHPAALRATRWWRRRLPSRARVLCRSADGLTVRLGEDASVELRLRSALLWPGRVFGALRAAHVWPGLAQYWHPVVLAAKPRERRRSEAYACVWTTPRRTWRSTGPPGLAGHWWWGHTDASAERAEALGSLEKAARYPVARGPRATFRRRPAAVAAFVWAAIGVALTVANDAGVGLVRGVVLLLAAVAAGAAFVVPQAALRETDDG